MVRSARILSTRPLQALSKAWRLPPFAPPFTKLISPSSLPHLPISLPGFPSPLPPRPPVRPLQALSKAWRLPPFEQCDLRAGLTCDAQGMVTRINLANRNLTGVIPKAISAFASLTNLSLHDNHLYGHLPDMGRLKLLRELYLHGNNLKGAVPASLSLLSNLEALNLGENALSGGIPVELGNLKALILLNLNSNRLVGSIPETLGKLSKLQHLYLSGNQISGSLPPAIGNLQDLEHLWIEDNKLTGPLPTEIGNCTSLQILYLSNNSISGSLPDSIGQLWAMRDMRLDNNMLAGALPPTMGLLSNLTVLELHSNQLSGALPATLGKPLPAVSHPFLPAYSYLPVALSHLCFPSTPPLSPRELHSNQLSGALPATLGKLSLLKALTINATAQPCPASSSLCLVSQSASSSFCHLCPEFCSSCEPLEEMAVENEGESGSDGNGGSGGGLSMAAIIAVVCGSLLLLTAVLVAFLVWCCCRPGSNPFKHVKVVDQEEFDDAGLIPSLCCRYSLVEIRRATGNWSEENRIGSGQHSDVYKGTCPYNPASTWAVKRYKERSTHFEKEVEQIASKWHPTLAHLLGYCVDSDTRVLRRLKSRLKSRLLGYCVDSDARVEGGRMVQGESRADQLTHPCVCPLVPCPLPPLKPHQVEQIASKWRAGWCRWRSRADQLTHPCVRPLPCTLVAHPITLPNHQVEQIASKWHPNLAHLLGYCADSNTRVEGGRMVQVEEQIGSPPTPVFALPVPCLPPNQVEQIASKWHPNLAHLLGYCVDSDTRVEGGRMVQVEEQTAVAAAGAREGMVPVEEQIAVYEYVHHGDLSRYLYQETFRASFALFGVIFLELLTGRPPFIQVQAEHGEDHEHIADWGRPPFIQVQAEHGEDHEHIADWVSADAVAGQVFHLGGGPCAVHVTDWVKTARAASFPPCTHLLLPYPFSAVSFPTNQAAPLIDEGKTEELKDPHLDVSGSSFLSLTCSFSPAAPLIDEGKTEELKDPHLDVPESSFLSLAELAIRCTAMPFTDRPPMGEVLATLKAIRTDFFGLTDPDDVYGGEGSGGMESGFGGGDGDGDARPDWGVAVNGV
ncbi:unnamed protein product [Closterium sp. NIES-65]|nr:unnamed protein product [Closterium sp. NIES-65]